MRISILLLVLGLVTCILTSDYDPLESTTALEVKDYGTQAAKDIRAIGRSYAFNMMSKNNFTIYLEEFYDLFLKKDVDIIANIKVYTKDYTPHVVMVGLGLILSVFLFVGFCFTPCCMMCCNKSQKISSAMAMWRMIWGSLLVILLAVNIAGIAIMIVSGKQMLSMGSDTNETIDSLGDGFVTYIDETNNQIEVIKDDRFSSLVGKLKPLVETVTNTTSSEIKTSTSPNFDTTVTGIIGALSGLDTTLKGATTTIDTIDTEIKKMQGYVDTINDNLGVCRSAITTCGSDCETAIPADTFDTAFDKDQLKAGQVAAVKTTISSLTTVNGKTIGDWSTEVQTKWDDLEDFIFEQSEGARTNYEKVLTDAEAQFKTVMEDDVIKILNDAKGSIITRKNDTKQSIAATMTAVRNAMRGKESDTKDSILGDLTNKAFVRYALMGAFILVCVLAALLILTVIIGLFSTIFGCCKVDDDAMPTERESGCCGSLLMCTSYCSVLLCAIATIVSALMLTVVMIEEGACKQHSDGNLVSGLESLTLKFDVNITKILEDAMETKLTVTFDEMMGSCKDNSTIIKALDIKKDTEIKGFSIDSVQTKIDEEVDKFDVESTIDSLTFDYKLMDDSTKNRIKNQKDDLTKNFDYATVKSYLSSAGTTKFNYAEVYTKLDNLVTVLDNNGEGAKSTKITGCKTKVTEIETMVKISPQGPFDISKNNLITELDTMSGLATTASGDIDKLVTNIDKLQTDLFTSNYIPTKLKESVNNGIATAKRDVSTFVDYMYEQFQTTILSCQPMYAAFQTTFNYTCDGIFIHLTLLYCSLSLIGLSLLLYMCVSRFMARYFIKFSRLHPDDEDMNGNGWSRPDILDLKPMSGSNKVVYPDKLLLHVF